jgi:hypothetical protein
MTPAQEAKAYAAEHGFTIVTAERKHSIYAPGGALVAQVSGYPAALNAMKRDIDALNVTTDDVTVSVDAPSDTSTSFAKHINRLLCDAWHACVVTKCGAAIKASFATRADAVKWIRQMISGRSGKLITSQRIYYAGV